MQSALQQSHHKYGEPPRWRLCIQNTRVAFMPSGSRSAWESFLSTRIPFITQQISLLYLIRISKIHDDKSSYWMAFTRLIVNLKIPVKITEYQQHFKNISWGNGGPSKTVLLSVLGFPFWRVKQVIFFNQCCFQASVYKIPPTSATGNSTTIHVAAPI